MDVASRPATTKRRSAYDCALGLDTSALQNPHRAQQHVYALVRDQAPGEDDLWHGLLLSGSLRGTYRYQPRYRQRAFIEGGLDRLKSLPPEELATEDDRDILQRRNMLPAARMQKRIMHMQHKTDTLRCSAIFASTSAHFGAVMNVQDISPLQSLETSGEATRR